MQSDIRPSSWSQQHSRRSEISDARCHFRQMCPLQISRDGALGWLQFRCRNEFRRLCTNPLSFPNLLIINAQRYASSFASVCFCSAHALLNYKTSVWLFGISLRGRGKSFANINSHGTNSHGHSKHILRLSAEEFMHIVSMLSACWLLPR